MALAVTGLDLLTASTSATLHRDHRPAEIGLGGAAIAIGLATNLFETSCAVNERFLESGIRSLEARVERTYGPTAWRKTEYAGAQVSLRTSWWWSPSVGWMFDVRDPAHRHLQVGLGATFWRRGRRTTTPI